MEHAKTTKSGQKNTKKLKNKQREMNESSMITFINKENNNMNQTEIKRIK